MGVLGQPAASRALALVVALCLGGPLLGAEQAFETDVKAAFLYNFTKFVDWPRPPGAAEPFRLCVVSDDALRQSLERTIEGESVNGRPLQSLVPRTPDEARTCQMLFVGHADGEREARLLSAVRDLPVLTVSDTNEFAMRGGGIEFVREHNRLRFDVNLPGAERAGIKVSSRLLKVARRVHESPKKK
jgi:YfiR/HmsC-like